MIVVTGASGQLGRLVMKELLTRLPPSQIVAAVRDPAKVADLAAAGVLVRQADYNDPASLAAAFKGADKLLMISGSEVGQRVAQHRNVIDAARRAEVGLVAYTSVLRASTSTMDIALEHKETEIMLKDSGLPHVLLRNGWYTENYAAGAPTAVQYGVLLGCAGEGRIASAARADYAAAAAVVLTTEGHAGKVYELAGDEAFTLTELAAEISRQAGKTIPYKNMSESEYKAALLGAGLPEWLAMLLSRSDAGAAVGGLFDDNRQLSGLLGRPTTPLAATVMSALSA